MSYANKLEELQRLRAEVRRLEQLAEREAKSMRPLTLDDEKAMASMQARADEAYTAAGRRAPPPLTHERPHEYRLRIADDLKDYSPSWKGKDLSGVTDETAWSVIETQLRADAIQHGRTHGLAARQMRPIEGRTAAGHTQIEWVGGPESRFVNQFRREPRRASFMKPEAYQAMTQASMMQGIVNAGRRPTMQSPRASF
jgi:hypothetical protein